MKKIFFILLLLGVIAGGMPHTVKAVDGPVTGGVKDYTALAPITSGGTNFVGKTVRTTDFSAYLNGMFKLGIAVAGALALCQMIIGGVQYMSTDAISGKSDGKGRIQAAVLGLVVALGSYMLLNTLGGEDLLKTGLNLSQVEVADIPKLLPGDPNYPWKPGDPEYGTITDSKGNTFVGTDAKSHGDPTYTDYDAKGNTVDHYADGSYSVCNTGEDGKEWCGTYDANGNQQISSGNTPGGSGPSTDAIIKNTAAGTTFPNQEWNDYALQKIKDAGLSSLSPSDAAKYFPNGVSDEAWLNFIASVAIPESGFNPNKSYYEKDMKDPRNSVGLMSLSAGDYGANGLTEEQLKDPKTNLDVAIKIMKHTVETGGCISCQSSSGNWKGAAAYWSPLRH